MRYQQAYIYAALDNAETSLWCACASVFGTVWSNAEHTVQVRVLVKYCPRRVFKQRRRRRTGMEYTLADYTYRMHQSPRLLLVSRLLVLMSELSIDNQILCSAQSRFNLLTVLILPRAMLSTKQRELRMLGAL